MKGFKKFIEETGFQSYAPLGISIPSVNTAGVVSVDQPQSNFTRKAYDTMAANKSPDEFELGLPSTQQKTQIYYINTKSNPIIISLQNGTTLSMDHYEFRRSGLNKLKLSDEGYPLSPANVLVNLQRRNDDDSMTYSQIKSIRLI